MLLLAVALLVFFVSVAGVLMTWNKVNMMSTELTRHIEIKGQVDSSAYTLFEELKATTNLDATMEITATYLSGSNRIQFGNSFTVTITYEASFGLGGVVDVPVTLYNIATGRSERYWKA